MPCLTVGLEVNDLATKVAALSFGLMGGFISFRRLTQVQGSNAPSGEATEAFAISAYVFKHKREIFLACLNRRRRIDCRIEFLRLPRAVSTAGVAPIGLVLWTTVVGAAHRGNSAPPWVPELPLAGLAGSPEQGPASFESERRDEGELARDVKTVGSPGIYRLALETS
jgi:hypothetical protein